MMRFLTEGHILVAGSLVLDILPRFASGDGDAIARDLLAQGRLTESSEFVIYLGGAVGNTGLALKRMGQPVHLMSKVGDDRVGAIVQSLLGRRAGRKLAHGCFRHAFHRQHRAGDSRP